MASPQEPATMADLPDDVLVYIFVRLPAKLLAQMRCVSKPWNALLSQPSFIKSHLDHPIYNTDEIYLLFQDSFYFDKPFFAIPCRTPYSPHPNYDIKLPPNTPSAHAPCSVIGSVNGLICFVHQSNPPVIHIWNPSLSALLSLPPYTTTDDIHFRFRFGFDPKTDDYKVVKLMTHLGQANSPTTQLSELFVVVKEWLQVEVYSMRKGSWNLITQRNSAHFTRIHNNEDEVCVDGHDGHLHWLGYLDEEMKQQTIVTFDLGVETFSEISLPDAIVDSNMHRRNALGVLDKKLCVMSHIIDSSNYEVWVMDEYGVAESWMKHQLFSQFIADKATYGLFTQYNEFLLDSCYKHLALYDSIVAKVKACRIMGYDVYNHSKHIKYVDSLVWVAPAKKGSAVATSIDYRLENSIKKALENLLTLVPSTSSSLAAVSGERNSEINDRYS